MGRLRSRCYGLRSAGEWSREDLAEATGAPVEALAEYEEGRRPLPREVLEEMISGLHLTEEDAIALGASIPRARPRPSGRPASSGKKEPPETPACSTAPAW